MDDIVKKYIKEKKEEVARVNQKIKEEYLIDLGLYEKEYSKENEYSDEYCNFEWDSEKEQNMYYKKKALNVTNEEYEEILKLNNIEKKSSNNSVAITLKVIAWVIYIGGFLASLLYGGAVSDFGVFLIMFSAMFASGTMVLGFAEIIKLLHDIKRKLK